ncbi:MAG TPA: amino acid adenylation domain-containing protein, partial [Thermoanaerobaculia bacterium]|nr:amino acid adenylation domain-containing protein [Thermoanaerobaculia bacterium]
EALRDLCRREGVTPFMALLAAWSLLLGRHAGQDDVLVGTPIAGRNRRETEDLIGFFVNTLVMRADLSGAPGFRGLLGQVRTTALDAYAHQDVPFERIVEELVPERDLSHSPLFQVVFALQNAPAERLEIPGLVLTPGTVDNRVTRFDLGLSLHDRADGFAGSLEHNTDLFDPATAAHLLSRLETLLEGIVEDPDRVVAELPLLRAAERQQVLREHNDTRSEYTREASLPALFAAVAKTSPEAPAVVDDEVWSYGRLDKASNRLARYLVSLGVRPGDRVGVAMERSADLLVALLAVLKTGAAYVPLDPGYPDERLAFLLEDTGAGVVLVHGRTRERLAALNARLVCLDADRERIAARRAVPLRLEVPAEALAYVIYTSGSTGKPKGVAVSHRAVLRLATGSYLTLEPGDRLAFNANTSFDAATFEIWATLLSGAALVVVSRDLLLDPRALAAYLGQHEVTVLHLTTALFNRVVREAPEIFFSLRCALFGGEAADPVAVAHAVGLERAGRLLHMYGPTESTTFATFHEVTEVEPTVPIGLPLANTTAYVLEPSGEPAPLGMVGELCLGGDGLAWGYLNRPDLTAERFVPDLFGPPGTRLYRTGDLARRRADGLLEYQGRVDQQVKVRGFRIEPGEVEAVLRSQVRESVVVARDGRLVAYVVGEAQPDALREHLRGRLPEHMVPSAFVVLDALPLTPNGKVDRKALPSPEIALADEEIIAPSDPVEELLAGIWTEVLGVERVGIHQDFFALGGHSLLATRVMSRLRDTFGTEVPVRRLFETPTVAGLAEAVRLARQSGAVEAPIVPVPRDGGLPLSFSQQRLWLIDRLEPGNAAFNMPWAVRLTGDVDPALLSRIFAEIVRRHETLRTTFEERDGRPVQVIAPEWLPDLPILDLSGLPERETLAYELARAEAGRPFDLGRGPLLRVALVRLDPENHVLLLTIHHIVSDGWSVGVLLREIAALYAGSPLPELPVQYADFAVWQRRWLDGEVLEAQLDWWRRELAGASGVLDLPTDRPRAALQSREGEVVPVFLSAGLTAGVRELARRQGSTPFMVLLAAFQTLLFRLCGQEDVLVGTPVANRGRLETEGLIGYLVNTLVLRGRFAAHGLTFRELLARTRETVLAAFEHKDAPFERLVDELALERSLAVSPLFQVLFSLQNTGTASLSLPGLTLAPLAVDSGKAKLDLSLYLEEIGGELRGDLEISRALFDTATVRRFLEAYALVVEGAVAAPERRVVEVPLLDEAQRHQVLREWNADGVAAPASVLELFERRVRLAPDAPALSQEGRRFNYAELDRWSNRLANRLLRLGMRPEARVAVLAERSPELIAALLGILKAGGVYVPLDPTYPQERIAYMLEDSGAVLLSLDEDLEGESDEAPRVEIETGQLAYVLYTSGSTGRPKGVMVSHGALARYVEAVRPVYGIGPGDRVLQFCSISFDTSLEEIMPCLTGGAELVLRTDAMLESPAVFLESCGVRGITAVSLPTAYWHEVAAKSVPLPPSLRLVILGGERALLERVESWRKQTQGRPRLVNTYGVTEATIVSTAVDLEARSAAEGRGEVSIGRVIDGAEAYLLDREREPVPVGTLGELHLGGALLARGYLGRPDLTAERFVPHPFAAAPGARLYRTGDLARALADGALEFAGRADRQIKVRGYRIEVEEIESRLLRHPEVESAVVVVREDQPGEKRIVAYVVPRGSVSPAALRAFVRETLPDYMVPGAYVALESLPLTPNGKLDRRALPAPERSPEEEDAGYVAPSDPVEELLAGIWAEVLDLERVGVHDDFFALGGHSLLATQVVSRVRGALGVEVALRQLFELPTVADLARAVRSARQTGTQTPLVRLPRDSEGLPLSFAQQRLWVIDQLEPGSPAYNLPLAVRLTGTVDPRRVERIFAAVTARHESLRTTFAARDGRPVQVIAAPDSRPRLPVVDLSHLPAAERETQAVRLAREDSRRPFDLQRGPLLRLALVRLDERDHLLLMTMHHIVSDGWSMGVLLREIASLYEGLPLPGLAVQYADFAVWQRGWLEGEVLASQLDFWRRELAGAPQVLELPTDRPRPPLQSFRGARLPLVIPAAEMDGLRALFRAHGATLFMGLLAAWQTLLHRHTGQDEIVVGSPVANRGRVELEPLIGFFANTLVLRTGFAGAPSFAGLLARVRKTAADAYAHQDVPFERLVEELQPERHLGITPLFQVMLVLQNAPMPDFELADLAMSILDLDPEVARFDLLLNLSEEADGRLGGLLEYSTDLFDEDRIVRLLQHFRVLLAGAAAEPERPVSELPLLTREERDRLLYEWNDNAAARPGIAVHEPVEEQAERSPDALAVLWAEGTDADAGLTYRELEQRANRLARHLRALGVGPDTRVAICLERSLDLPVAVLAVLKAGGAYVPVDPDYPADRVAFMLADSRSRVLITTSAVAGRLPEHGVRAVLLDADREAIAARSAGAPVRLATPGNLAYVIYTSGSTGLPKGVAMPHGVVANMLAWQCGASAAGLGSRTLQFASLSFDVSFQEIFSTWWTGGAVVLVPQETRRDTMALSRLLHEREVERLFLPFVALQQLAEGIEQGAPLPAALAEVCTAGEQLRVTRQITAWMERSGTVLENHYGPSEGHAITVHRL